VSEELSTDENRPLTWEEEYARRVEENEVGTLTKRFALTGKERFEVQQIIREELRAAYTEVFFGESDENDTPYVKGQTMPGLLGTKPSRHFKIFREAEPAIFRFNGVLYIENFNLDANQFEFVSISEEGAAPWLAANAPSLRTTAEAATTPTPSQVQDGNAEETVESIMVRTRRHYWETRFDQGYHGHLAGNKEKWVNDQLDREGYL